MTTSKTAIIIGAGPAGLTAAYELLQRTDIQPIVLEADDHVGGISATINHNGNRMDLGGHRFFSKSDWVMDWWQRIMPIEQQTPSGPIPAQDQPALLMRNRLSRILFLRQLFSYPLSLSLRTLRQLGLGRLVRILFSYLGARLTPIHPEQNLEQFFINRFGRELYQTFFRNYTEKVWGVPCAEISAEWGQQRIKGLSITKSVLHALKRLRGRSADVAQKGVETSLIERFLYPKQGPGQMWESVAAQVQAQGGVLHFHQQVVGVELEGERIVAVTTRNAQSGEQTRWAADYVFSTMAIKDLIQAAGQQVPEDVYRIATQLQYRDFLTVGVLVRKDGTDGEGNQLEQMPDNWIYVQEDAVKMGRIQIFNNWSPYLVNEEGTLWVGLEYFCQEGDALWQLSDAAMAELAIKELQTIGFVDPARVLDHTVVRVKKAYPAYFGSYAEFDRVRDYLDSLPNLFPIGRNGMHRYNNQDHSMLSAKAAVECIERGSQDKSALWQVNAEEEYHEERSA